MHHFHYLISFSLILLVFIDVCITKVLVTETTKPTKTNDSNEILDEEEKKGRHGKHAVSKYSGLVPRHSETKTSLLYGRMKVLNWYMVRRKNQEVGALRYGLNSDDMHITLELYVDNLKIHIPVQKTYLHERQGKARKVRRKYLYWFWRRWRYLLSAKERMPILVEDEDLRQMPIDPLERVYSYVVEVIEIPSVLYLEMTHCMYFGIKPYIHGLLASYSLQDLVGASLYSIDSDGSFKDYYCLQAVNMWSDDQIVPHSPSICSRMKNCLDNKEFKDKKYKNLIDKYSKKIDEIYQKKRFIGADSSRTFAKHSFVDVMQTFHEFEAHKRPDYIEKLFVPIRAIRFINYANELLIRSGVKKKPVFKAQAVSDVIQYSVYRVDPVSMVRFCVAHFLTTRFKFRKNMGIAIIEEACVHSLSFGFINDTGKLPPKITRSQARQIINQHFSNLSDDDAEASDEYVVVKSHDQRISVDEKGNINKSFTKSSNSEESHEVDEDSHEEDLDDEEDWNKFMQQYIE